MNSRTTPFLVLVASCFLASGCTSMSGYDSKSEFSCKAPPGILCDSMTGVYTKAISGTLPAQNFGRPAAAPSGEQYTTTPVPGTLSKPIYSGVPIRQTPQIVRIWLAPWEDSDGDLHDQSFMYVVVNDGAWLIQHNRSRIMNNFQPVMPVKAPAGSLPASSAPGGAAQPSDAAASAGAAAAAMMQDMLRPSN